MPPVWRTGNGACDRDRQRQEEGQALLPGVRPEAGIAQAAGPELDRDLAIGDRPARRRGGGRVVAIDLPLVRYKVYGVQGGGPLWLPPGLPGVPRTAPASSGADPSRLPARRQGPAARPEARRLASGT